MSDSSSHALYITPETVYGVTDASPVWEKVRHTGTTLAITKNTSQSEEIRDDRQINDFTQGTEQVGGDISAELSYASFDTLLEAALCGTWAIGTIDADTPPVGTDELTTGVTRRSFSALRHFSDQLAPKKAYHKYNGCEVNTFAISMTTDAKVSATFGIIGRGLDLDTVDPTGSTYNAVSTTRVLDSFSGVVKENGVVIGIPTEISFTLENGIEPRFVLGSRNTIRPSIGRSNLSGQLTVYFEDETFLEKFLSDADSSLEFTLPDAAGNLYTVIIPKIKYSGGQPDVSGQGSITLAMPFQAILDTTSNTNMIVRRKSVV